MGRCGTPQVDTACGALALILPGKEACTQQSAERLLGRGLGNRYTTSFHHCTAGPGNVNRRVRGEPTKDTPQHGLYNGHMVEPRRLTPDVQQRIIDHVAEGNYPEVAAQLAGVPRRTFQRWLHDGRQDLDQGVEASSVARLALAVEKARAECVAHKVKRVQQAGEKSWQADAWWLERNFPAMYGRNERVQIEQHSISVHVMPKLTEGQQAMMIRLLAEQDPPRLAPPSTAP